MEVFVIDVKYQKMNIFLRTFDLYLIMDHAVACKRFYFNYVWN